MNATASLTRTNGASVRSIARYIDAMGASTLALIREWRQRCCSRQELALYSYDERSDLGFAVDLDAEIVKPLWTK
jgi:hypothetical protein